jgi:enolase
MVEIIQFSFFLHGYLRLFPLALDLISAAIEKAGYTGKIDIGMDVAASEFYKEGKYDLDFKNPQSDPSTYLEPSKLGDLYLEFIKEFPIVSVEDPFDQDDWEAWSSLTSNTNIQVLLGNIFSVIIYLT